jgi:hypothetical protein
MRASKTAVAAGRRAGRTARCDGGSGDGPAGGARVQACSRGNMVGAPWLVNGGHGASLRHHNDPRGGARVQACSRGNSQPASATAAGGLSRKRFVPYSWKKKLCC